MRFQQTIRRRGLRPWLGFWVCCLGCLAWACNGAFHCLNPDISNVQNDANLPDELDASSCQDLPGENPPGGQKPDGQNPTYFPPPPAFDFDGHVFPNALISRGKPAFSSVGRASAINDGNYRWDGETWSNNGQAGWVAIRLEAGPSHVLFQWSSGANYNYTDMGSGAPRAYRIEVSSDSTNGSDGKWESATDRAGNEVNVTGNNVRTRTHLLNFRGMSWVRMQIPAGVQANLDEIDVYDANEAQGNFDSWFFLGDSITAHAFDRSKAHGSFAELVHKQGQGFFPMVVNGGVGGDKTAHALARLPGALVQHPDIQFWAVCLGSNDVGWGGSLQELGDFRKNLLEIVKLIKDAGRIPIIPTIPFNGHWNGQECIADRPDVPKFNQAIQEVIQQTDALPGPDIYTYFAANCRQLPDNLHPNAEGYRAINQLWAEAMASIYNAQSQP